MLFQWCFHGHWTLLTSISLLALPLSLFLLCFLFHRRLRNDEVSLPPTQRTEEREEAETASSSMVSSSEDDGHHGDSGSNTKREFVICAVCASRLVVSGPNRTWAPAAAIEDGRLKREQGDFVVCASSLAASSGGNGKTGEEEEADFVVCTSRLVEQSGGDETGEEKAAIDDGKSKKVGFAISDGKSSSSVSASIIDQVESSQKQELVVRTSKSAVQIGGMGTEAAIINGQETNPNEEELGPDGNQESAVDEFFSCVSSMVPIVTGGSEAGAAIDLVRLSIGEVEEEGELGSCSKLLMAIDNEDDDDEQQQEEKEESLVVNASSLAPGMVSGG
ncbi:unnamed protein product [Linum trigynum]|uniref:Uncharacterized protein n=1 Tax=Linum trigynum TaxID=586398 RepID=A0AAV2EIV3_9ROSI